MQTDNSIIPIILIKKLNKNGKNLFMIIKKNRITKIINSILTDDFKSCLE